MSSTAVTMIGSEPTLRLRDNPLALAMGRRRLRRKQALPMLLVVLIIGICALLFGAAAGESDPDAWLVARHLLLVTIAALLYLGGASQIGANLSDDRKSGLLDFHRATPTSAWTDTLGYALGSAAREYVGALSLIPFALIATVLAGESIVALPVALVVILVSGWMYHTMVMLTSLVSSRKRVARSSMGLVVLLVFFGGSMAAAPGLTLAHLTPLPALIELGVLGESASVGELSFFGLPFSHTVFTILLQGTLIVFLFWASARKIRREGTHAFSRPGALAFFTMITFLVAGAMWASLTSSMFAGQGISVFLGGMLALASVMAVTLVPTYLDFVRATRRARKVQSRPHWLEDGASAWPLIGVFFAVIAGWFLVMVFDAADVTLDWHAGLALYGCLGFLAFAVGVPEYLRFSMRKASGSGVFLISFLSLVLPWILGAIFSMAMSDSEFPNYVMATSPLYGVGGSVVILGMHWGPGTSTPSLGPILFSLGLTTVLAAYFHVRAYGLRNAIASSIDEPRSGPDGGPMRILG
jgi:hypothetical protein